MLCVLENNVYCATLGYMECFPFFLIGFLKLSHRVAQATHRVAQVALKLESL